MQKIVQIGLRKWTFLYISVMTGVIKVYKCQAGIYINVGDDYFKTRSSDWDEFINREGLYNLIGDNLNEFTPVDENEFVQQSILAPIGSQEVWASGVTYKRSREARMEESKKAKGDSFYEMVYDAERPELFFKATSNRVSGPEELVNIRKDSMWNVPEPELTLFISSTGTIEGYTIGNDMSSRSIEGENPLYLPQAKTYDKSAALGPCIALFNSEISKTTQIEIIIKRVGVIEFESSITLNAMKRTLSDLRDYLFKECTFPFGCFLMTGTGIVPPSEFTLSLNDEISISIEGIGTLTNTVGQK